MGFQDLGVDLSPSDVVMSWLRLQHASDWIPHPYWTYTKCFCTLIWCEWAYGYTLTLLGLCRWGVDFGVLGADLSPSDVVMSWLRLQHASDWISHPYWMYTKFFGTLIWCKWTYGSTLALLGLCRSGVDFGVLGADLSPSDVVMSLLRLQHASDWIPHPYWMYTKCFGTLIWCEWTYGSTLILLGLCRWGVGFGFFVVGRLQLVQVML